MTPRRFLAVSNPPLAQLITGHIGERWLKDLTQLRRLEPLAEDADFRARWRAVKLTAKQALAARIADRTGVTVDPASLFDIQAKRIHESDLNVSNAQHLYPAADLSEQISTAGKEASGTGNMKFALNGALTIGTLDGANIEIREEIGPENFFLFGLNAAEVARCQAGDYHPWAIYEQNPGLREVLDFAANGALAGGDTRLFRPLLDNLLGRDPFLVLADYQAYVDCQEQVSARWQDPETRSRQSILTVARMGRFSSDRAIREYCEQIWQMQPLAVPNSTGNSSHD